MAWEYGFLEMAAEVFDLMVLGVLPAVVIIILVIYMNRIVRAFIETRRLKAQMKPKKAK